MAPRRGGGGTSFDIDSVHCSDYAFESTTSRVRIAFNAIFFVVYLVLSGMAAARYLRSRNKGTALRRWWALALSMISGIIAIIITIIVRSLSECRVGNIYKVLKSQIGMAWLFYLSEYLMVAVLMVPIIRRLHEGAGKTAKLVTIIHTAYLVLLAIIYVSWMGVYTYLSNESYTYYYGTVGDYLYIHYYRLSLAYDVLAVIGVLMAGINMVISMLRSKSSHWNTGLKIRILLLVVMALGMTLVELGSHVVMFYSVGLIDEEYLEQSGSARLFLEYFFYSCAFVLALSIAGSRQLRDGDPPIYQPPVNTGANFQQPYDGVPVPQVYHSPQNQYPPQSQWHAQSPHGGY